MRAWIVVLSLALVGCSLSGTVTHFRRNGRPACEGDIAVPIFDIGLAAGGVALGVMLNSQIKDDALLEEIQRAFAIALISSGVVAGVSAINGFKEVQSCENQMRQLRAEEHEAELASAERGARREAAWQRTKHAASAARSGDCATVATLDVEVARLDADLHATVFLRDVAIANCLASAAAGAR